MISGHLRKLKAVLKTPVEYELTMANESIPLNALLGCSLNLKFQDEILCVNCNQQTKTSFNQGHCFRCFKTLASCDLCIMKPETCHFAQGTCRDETWANDFCMQPHIVYLANSSAMKVGITRMTQMPTRWIDQGAEQALPIFEVKTRYHSGLIESIFKDHVSDRTNWRNMLKANAEPIDLLKERDQLLLKVEKYLLRAKKSYSDLVIEPLLNENLITIQYPILEYPKKIQSLSFEKTPEIQGTLLGIKGQYLILDTGVLNIRKYTGYSLHISLNT